MVTSKPKAKAKTKAKAKAKAKAKKPAARGRKINPVPEKPKAKKGAGGRATKYRKEYDQLAYEMCLMGATNAVMAEAFDVNESTIENWLKNYPTFATKVRAGKLFADGKVAAALYNRAVGQNVEEWRETMDKDGEIHNLKTTKQLPGEVNAQRFWLKNRQPDNWKENITVTDNEGNGFQLVIHETLKPEAEPNQGQQKRDRM